MFYPALMTENEKAIQEKMKSGYMLATDIVDYLVKAKVPFREAYDIVGQIIQHCEKTNTPLFNLKLADLKKIYKKATKSIINLLDYKKSIKSKKSAGKGSRTELT